MAERIDQTGLSFPVRHIVSRVISTGATRSRCCEYPVDVVDAKHDLMSRFRNSLVVSKLTHYQLGALAVYSKLHPVGVADADMLDQPEHLAIPGGRVAHVGYSEHWDHPRPRRRLVRLHSKSLHQPLITLNHIADTNDHAFPRRGPPGATGSPSRDIAHDPVPWRVRA